MPWEGPREGREERRREHTSTRRAVRERDAETHTALNDEQLARPDHQPVTNKSSSTPHSNHKTKPENQTNPPNSVCTSIRPCCGKIKKSPSLLQNAFFSMLLFPAYMWIAIPSRSVGSPFPAMDLRPSTKSVGADGMGGGCQACWVGEVCTRGLRGEKLFSNCR